MPSEHRFLIFTDGEVMTAVSDYRKRQGHPLPSGKILRMQLLAEPEVELGIRVETHDRERRIDVLIDYDELRSAIVYFCIKREIPLPATGFTKTLSICDRKLMMTATRIPNRPEKNRKHTPQSSMDWDRFDLDVRPSGTFFMKCRG